MELQHPYLRPRLPKQAMPTSPALPALRPRCSIPNIPVQVRTLMAEIQLCLIHHLP